MNTNPRQHDTKIIKNKSGSWKLNSNEVLAIKLLLEEKYTHNQIAEFFGVSNVMISKIATGERWSNIELPVREFDATDTVLNELRKLIDIVEELNYIENS